MLLRLLTLFLLFSANLTGNDIRQTLSLEETFRPGQTLIWSPGFQKCWDEMLAYYKLENPQFNPPNPLANKLNQFKWEYEKTVPKKSQFSVVAGTGEEYWRSTNQRLRRHFGDLYEPLPRRFFGHPDVLEGLVIISIINHQLYFNTSLGQNPSQLYFNTVTPRQRYVKSFGTFGKSKQASAGLVKVLAYEPNKKRKAIILEGKDSSEEVVLISDPGLTTPEEVIQTANRWTEILNKNHNRARHYNDSSDKIVIPEISFTSEAQFTPLFPGTINLGQGRFVSIVQSAQKASLTMSRKGTEMKTKTFIVAATFLSGGIPNSSPIKTAKNRDFTFNEPFFLMIRKQGATLPFLLARIDHSALVDFR